jgi:hypothetical protein
MSRDEEKFLALDGLLVQWTSAAMTQAGRLV